MALIPEKDKAYIKDKFEKELVNDVTIDLFVRPESGLFVPGRQPNSSKETQSLLEEVAECSDKITLNVVNLVDNPDAAAERGIDGVPAFILKGPDGDRVRYFGLPGGYEFATLLEDLSFVSANEPSISTDLDAVLAGLTEDIQIQVFVTPT